MNPSLVARCQVVTVLKGLLSQDSVMIRVYITETVSMGIGDKLVISNQLKSLAVYGMTLRYLKMARKLMYSLVINL